MKFDTCKIESISVKLILIASNLEKVKNGIKFE